MPYLKAILTDPVVQMAIALLGFALVLAFARIPRPAQSRKRVLWGLWLITLVGLGQWAFWLQDAVIAGGHLPSTYDTVAVPIKGTIRYVPLELAYRHDASKYLFLLSLPLYLGVIRLARVDHEG